MTSTLKILSTCIIGCKSSHPSTPCGRNLSPHYSGPNKTSINVCKVVCVKPKGWHTVRFILIWFLMRKCYTYLQLEPFMEKKKRCYVCVREGTFVWPGQKEESRLRIDGCEQRSDLRWTLADGWMKEDTQLHRSLTPLLSSSLRLCSRVHSHTPHASTNICSHVRGYTHNLIFPWLSLFRDGICGQSRVSPGAGGPF